ncbi:putative allantoinase 1 [Neolecta irregularis DAH-3]|uniref:Putative allantoinase 1 n=1 Tax=Neolecta irregularis (strain DAH-3) TaxID=1198029 RepID=A0A1U7LR38_NEOID|nr:putative allantoinase 1 [Neolecta irregularis DAH-3]|eukprot:OLL25136.1 putative allantoinase 1 [Neolecta irregularis DAH-3]
MKVRKSERKLPKTDLNRLSSDNMVSYRLPDIQLLKAAQAQEISAVTSNLFEKSESLEDILGKLISEMTYHSYPDLISDVRSHLVTLTASQILPDKEALFDVINAHPRLGARKVDSAQSIAEQKSLVGESEALRLLNEEYEETFPRLRYVVFVNGRSREVIMRDMKMRIQRGDIEAEKLEAVNAMYNIALDRAGKLSS